ncbi:restriction endonuclease subunit S [Vibrio vulnificus]|uniref:restriction endonuclease subunit S n=1 Tax=Vibrio vulnificus TaxID=672 RepID=UPI001CDB99AA|nr:restriction endonuclease subunit S [Vibrio vulnificus]MCA3894916.1 restriction endonuclease subunit S [Vibrio vulnificus]
MNRLAHKAGWRELRLSDVIKVKSGDSLSKSKMEDGDFPVFGGNGISGYHSTYNTDETKIVIGRVGEYCGAVHKTPQYSWITDNALYVHEKKVDITDEYLFYLLDYLALNQYANRNAQPLVSGKTLEQIACTLPSCLIEQQKIAKVLSTVDKKIDLIDQKIAETEKLKTGLMQKLFSEGIGVQDENGDWQPHAKFQDSPFGTIPAIWNLNKLSTYCSIVAGVSPSKLNLNESEGYPFFKVEEFNYSKKLLTKSRNYVSNQASCHTGEFLLLPKRGAAIFLNKLRLAKGTFQIDTNVMGISFDKEVANLDFMLYRLLFERLESIADVSTIPQINNKHINPYIIPLPPLGEQQKIAQIISTVFEKIDLLEQQKAETQQLKKGLMQKLLTGEWRVPVEETEAA